MDILLIQYFYFIFIGHYQRVTLILLNIIFTLSQLVLTLWYGIFVNFLCKVDVLKTSFAIQMLDENRENSQETKEKQQFVNKMVTCSNKVILTLVFQKK